MNNNNNQEIITKVCSCCNLEKELTEYNKQKTGKHGTLPTCKICCKNYRIQNKDKLTTYAKEYYNNNKNIILEKTKKYKKEYNKLEMVKNKRRERNARKYVKEKRKEYNQQYRNNNKEKIKQYNQNNKIEINGKALKQQNSRYANDVTYRTIKKLRARLRIALKSQNATKDIKTLDLLGCSIEEFKIYMQSKFKDGMHWGNNTMHGWHIDHIKPCLLYTSPSPRDS